MDWAKYAKPGDKVVCIDDSPGVIDTGDQKYWLELNKVYTIREVTAEFDVLAISVEELPATYRDPKDGQVYAGYLAASRFRPVTPRATDISVFTRMLKKAKAPTHA